MSYCRWSSMNFKCDLYMYADCAGGWTIHVAGNKIVTPVFPIPSFRILNWPFGIGHRVWIWAHRLQSLTIRFGLRRNVGGPYAGQTLRIGSLEDVREMLLNLRQLGYRFHDSVLEAVEEEIREELECHSAASPDAITSFPPAHG